jgi:hypothetical protein
MLKEVRFIEEIGLWLATFGDVNLLYDDIIRDIWLPGQIKQITDRIILLRDMGIGKLYHFSVEEGSNVNITKNFFLYRELDSEVLLVYDKPNMLVFEENGKTVYKPDKVRYYPYRKTKIYYISPRNVYHIYYEGVKLITPYGEILINKAHSKA